MSIEYPRAAGSVRVELRKKTAGWWKRKGWSNAVVAFYFGGWFVFGALHQGPLDDPSVAFECYVAALGCFTWGLWVLRRP